VEIHLPAHLCSPRQSPKLDGLRGAKKVSLVVAALQQVSLPYGLFTPEFLSSWLFPS
jgi:hypothetical protein